MPNAIGVIHKKWLALEDAGFFQNRYPIDENRGIATPRHERYGRNPAVPAYQGRREY
jgi:hypothetical protein